MQVRRAAVHRLLVLVLVLAATAGLVSLGASTLIPGGGKKKTDCFVEADIDGVMGTGPKISCTDGEPCDHDGQCPNKSCTFHVRACVNQTNVTGCVGGTFKKPPTGFVKVGKTKTTLQMPSSGCGNFVDVVVPAKGKHKPKPAGVIVLKGKEKGTDSDHIPLTCAPVQGACATTTTTTTTTVPAPLICVTTTTLPTCGNGVVDAGEDCDPPCGTGCAGGQFCNSSCKCVATTACACGTTPTRMNFTTGVGSGNCGAVVSSTGSNMRCLSCGGLYFGGGGEAVPLPARVPDMGSSLTGVGACSDTCLTLTNLTSTQTGSNLNCTSVGCLFGPPLPIPNTAVAPLSTCVINSVATNAQGSAQCDTGSSSLNLPLTSTIYLYGDLLNGTTADRPDVPGIQPCPLCMASKPPGGSCAAAHCCWGGPNHDMPCTPQSGNLGDAYPTSHDCPPKTPPIGSLPIPFALTTGISRKAAVPSGTQQRVFCGFCRDAANTLCFEGDPGSNCPHNDVNASCTGAGAPFACCTGAGTGTCGGCTGAGAPWPCCTGANTGTCEQMNKPCTSNATCTDGSGTWPDCEQRNPGAFHQLAAANLFEVGARAGSLIDGAPHASTLVSVFCIPPTGNAAVDAAADLPGPGSVSLPGQAQLLP